MKTLIAKNIKAHTPKGINNKDKCRIINGNNKFPEIGK